MIDRNWRIRLNPRSSLRQTLLGAFITLTVLAVLVATSISIWNSRRTIQRQVVAHLTSVAVLKKTRVETWLEERQQFLGVTSSTGTFARDVMLLSDSDPGTEEYDRAFKELQNRLILELGVGRPFVELFVVDWRGRVIVSTDDESVGNSHTFEAYFREGMQAPFVQSPVYDSSIEDTVIILAHPIVYDGEEMKALLSQPVTYDERDVGVLVGRLNLARLQVVMEERAGLGETGETYLVSKDKKTLTPLRFTGANAEEQLDTEGIEAALAQASDSNYALYKNYRGEPVVGVYLWVPKLQVALLAEQEESEAFIGIQRMIVFNLGVGALVVILSALAAVVITQLITEPIAQLTTAATMLANGDLDQRVKLKREDEIGVLARAFNKMALQLSDLVRGLEQRVEQRTQALATAYQRVERQMVQLTTAARISRAATSVLDVDELLTSVVELVRSRLKFYYVGIFLVDDDFRYAVLRAGTGHAGEIMVDRGHKLEIGGQSMVGACIASEEAKIALDVGKEAVRFNNPLLPDTRSELALPLASRGQIVGAMTVQSVEEAAFSKDDISILQLMADQLANSIINALLYKSEQKRRHWSDTLREVSRLIGSTLELQEVLSRILDQLAIIVPYDRAAVILQTDERQMKMMAVRGFPDEQGALEAEIPIHVNDIFEQLKQTEHPLVIPDVRKAKWYQIDWLPLHRSWMGVPLIARDRVFGMISLTRKEADAFEPDEAAVVSTFAGQSAIALENARLYEQVKGFSEQLEEMVKQRTEELNEAYHSLGLLEKAKSKFINVAAHELRTPLTVIQGFTQILLDHPVLRDVAEAKKSLTGIIRGTERLHAISNSMIDMVRIDSQAMDMDKESVAISDVIERTTVQFSDALRRRNLTLTMHDLKQLPQVRANHYLLSKVFYNLIVNAIKYTPDGGAITISGQKIIDESGRVEVEIVVADTGIGIDPEHHEMIFEKFYQVGDDAFHSSGQTKFKAGGTALGLALAKSIIAAHDGQIWVESSGCDEESCPGSKFFVRLPAVNSG